MQLARIVSVLAIGATGPTSRDSSRANVMAARIAGGSAVCGLIRQIPQISRRCWVGRRPPCFSVVPGGTIGWAAVVTHLAQFYSRQLHDPIVPKFKGFLMKLGVFVPNWIGDVVMATPALRSPAQICGRLGHDDRCDAPLRSRGIEWHAMVR